VLSNGNCAGEVPATTTTSHRVFINVYQVWLLSLAVTTDIVDQLSQLHHCRSRHRPRFTQLKAHVKHRGEVLPTHSSARLIKFDRIT